MISLWRKLRTRHEKRHLNEENAEREIDRRDSSKDKDARRAQALFIALGELHRTMDPLMAVQIYNHGFCPLISQLPEEILLCIIDCLYNDLAALLCIRMVSRIFLRLIGSRPFSIWADTCTIRGVTVSLDRTLRLQFRQLLRKDGRCSYCKRWNAARGSQLMDECKFQRCHSKRPHGITQLCCDACDSFHEYSRLSPSYQDPSHRRCLGQQGSVQLCAHVQITWATIKAHIDGWRDRRCGAKGGQACLDSFSIECHDISHDTRCTASTAPTWPRARLVTWPRHPDMVVLNLEWKPHTRLDAIALTVDGRLPAPELRAVFRRLRSLGPADALYPAAYPGFLPEMTFFSPSSSFRQFVYYNMVNNDAIVLPPRPFLPDFEAFTSKWTYGHGLGRNGAKLDIRPHLPSEYAGKTISSQCLEITYERDIMICKRTALTDSTVKIVPTEHWLHAMDTDTYPHPQAPNVRPQCRDVACVNYYRNRRDWYYCSDWMYDGRQ